MKAEGVLLTKSNCWKYNQRSVIKTYFL